MPEQRTVLQLAPFVDVGTVWNKSGKTDEQDSDTSNTLASAGLGLRLQLGDNLTARFDWGIPLVNISSEKRTLQENGIYFSVVSTLF